MSTPKDEWPMTVSWRARSYGPRAAPGQDLRIEWTCPRAFWRCRWALPAAGSISIHPGLSLRALNDLGRNGHLDTKA